MTKKKTQEQPAGGTTDQPATSPKPRTRGMMVALSPESEALLRKVAQRTGLSLARLRAEIEAGPELDAAVHDSLRRAHAAWKASQTADDLFESPRDHGLTVGGLGDAE